MPLPRSFFLKLSAGCFALGACMELFMIKTGFYDVVKRNEVERLEESRDEQVAFGLQVAQALEGKGVEPPPTLQQLKERALRGQQHKEQ